MMKLRSLLRIRLLILLLVLLCLLRGDGLSPRDFLRYQVDPFVGPYLFDWWRYEVEITWEKAGVWLRGVSLPPEESERIRETREYFDLVDEIGRLSSEIERAVAEVRSRAEIESLEREMGAKEEERRKAENGVEGILRGQVEEILAEEGLVFNLPFTRELVFPPLEFEFQTSPHLLVISPRERIETLEKISLLPFMKQTEMEEVERQVDSFGVSSLVVPTGGMASYPPIIIQAGSLSYVMGAIIHEWTHNYLYFFPLGQHYSDSQELITMNETVASLVEEELSLRLARRYYPDIYLQKLEAERIEEGRRPGEFDFNSFMRETRLKVDELLAAGEVEEAEAYMEERRVELVEKGYYIRRLNQAYFAFHGSYATAPTSVSPIGGQMEELRRRSPSLAHFLRTVAQMRSYQDLLEALAD